MSITPHTLAAQIRPVTFGSASFSSQLSTRLVGVAVAEHILPYNPDGFHVEPDPDIRQSTCCPLQLWTRED